MDVNVSDAQLCHIIDELLAFDRTIEGVFGYSSLGSACPWTGWPRCIDVFTSRPGLFQRWAEVDAKAAECKFSALPRAPEAWQTRSERGGVAHPLVKPAQFSSKFAQMFRAMTDRYRFLTSREHCCYFFNVIQRPLLEVFREEIVARRAQLEGGFTRSNWIVCCELLEAVQFTSAMLQDATSDLLFLEMKFHAKKGASPGVDRRGFLIKAAGGTGSTVGIGPTAVLSAIGRSAHTHRLRHGSSALDGAVSDESEQIILSADLHAMQEVGKSLLSDSMTSLQRTFRFLTRGYSGWLHEGRSYHSNDSLSPHFQSALSWISFFLETARRVVGLLTWNALMSAVSVTLREELMIHLKALESVSLEAGEQYRRDVAAIMDLGMVREHFGGIRESSLLLALPEIHVTSLLESAEVLLEAEPDATAETHLIAMLAAHGVTELPLRDALSVLRQRKRGIGVKHAGEGGIRAHSQVCCASAK